MAIIQKEDMAFVNENVCPAGSQIPFSAMGEGDRKRGSREAPNLQVCETRMIKWYNRNQVSVQ